MPPESLAAALSAAIPLSPYDPVAEANHRIANNLSLVTGLVRIHARNIAQAGKPMDSAKVCALLEEIGARVESIARLHSLLATGKRGESIDLDSYLREVSAIVVSSLTSRTKAKLTHEPTSTDCTVPAERAVTIGLIVGELVTNAMKYSHPTGVVGVIAVGCSNAGDTMVVEVADDGVGLPEGFDPKKNGGLGLLLAHSLANQLSAKLAFNDSGIGLSVTLQIPNR
jgi:two-component sensor histidine kinase